MAVADAKIELRRFREHLFQLRLIGVWENSEWIKIISERAKRPIAFECAQRNTGVVLHDRAAMLDQKIADRVEVVAMHQVRCAFQERISRREFFTERQEACLLHAGVRKIRAEIIKRTRRAVRVHEIDLHAASGFAESTAPERMIDRLG